MRMEVLMVMAAVITLGGCQTLPLQAAEECFESNGLLIFDSFGDIACMDRAQYALSRIDNGSGLVSSQVPEPNAIVE